MENSFDSLPQTIQRIREFSIETGKIPKILIESQLRILTNMANGEFGDLPLFSDSIIPPIDAILRDKSGINEDNNGALAQFVHSMYMISKARYLACLREKKEEARKFVRISIESSIASISLLISSMVSNAVQNVLSLIEIVKNAFLSNKRWVDSLLNFFQKNSKYREAKEEYFEFIDSIFNKLELHPELNKYTTIYIQIANQNKKDLIKNQEKKIEKEHPMSGKTVFIVWMFICAVFVISYGLGIVLGGISIWVRFQFYKRHKEYYLKDYIIQYDRKLASIIHPKSNI